MYMKVFHLVNIVLHPTTPARTSGADKNCSTASDQAGYGCYADVIDAVIKYEGTFDGVTVGATYGMVGGNTNIIAAAEYNDLEGTIYTANLGYGGLTVQYKYQEMDDSGQLKLASTDDGDNTGSTICRMYAAGNVSAGICGVETGHKSLESQVKTIQKQWYMV